MQSKTVKILIIVGSSVVGVLLILYALFQFLVHGKEQTVLYYEAGYPAEVTTFDLLEGPEFLVNLSSFEDGGFNPSIIGEYKLSARHGFFTYEATAIVQDTLAPELSMMSEPAYAKVSEPADAYAFIESLVDVGSNAYLEVKSDAPEITIRGDAISASEVGSYEITFTATDDYNNAISESISITFDTAPVIEGFQDYYVIAGTEIDYLEGITASDDVSGDVTASLNFDDNSVHLDANGNYSYYVTAIDEYGLSTVQEIHVVVDDAINIQELINTHEINRLTEHIVGAYNLYDGGYFEEDDINAVLEYYNPAFVAVTDTTPPTRSRGSGFIVKIDDDKVYFVTNYHVVDSSDAYNIEFYDGTSIVCDIIAKSGQSTNEQDIALLSVNRSDIPQELMDSLMTVHINYGYWQTVDGTELSLGIRTVKDSMGLRGNKDYTGYLDGILVTDSVLGESHRMTRYKVGQISGLSGSAVVDGYGNLISVATLYTATSGGAENFHHEYGLNLQTVLDYCETNLGEPVYYY